MVPRLFWPTHSCWPLGVRARVSGSPGTVTVRLTVPVAVLITDTLSESGLAT